MRRQILVINPQRWQSTELYMIYDTQNMASGPITTWQIDGEKVEIVTDFIFLDSKITVDSDCSHEIKGTCSLEEKL